MQTRVPQLSVGRFAPYCAVLIFVFFLLSRSNASADTARRLDSTSPNIFWFTSDVYYVDEDASNAVVTVEFTPGTRSWSGSVNYSVSNGTAIAGEDYIAVSGTLNFSGPGTPVPKIIIPILKDNRNEGNETVQIFLSSPDAIITQGKATLIIVDRPKIKISPSGGQVVISWPSEYVGFVLEKSDSMAGGIWSQVTAPCVVSNGSSCITEPASGAPVFYRLCRTNSP